MRRRGGFSDGRTPYCLAQWHAFPGAACTSRPIPRAARRGSRKRLVATASRCERACKRTGEPSGAFCGKGGARERCDGGFIAADASAKSKKDVGAKRTLYRRGGFSDGRTPYCLDRRRVFSVRRARPRPIPRAARRGSRKRLVTAASRCERACKRTGEPSGAFCGKGGARERCDGGFLRQMHLPKAKRRRSKADFAPARRFFRRAHAILSRLAARFFGAACTPRPISRAARRGSRKRLVATASRCERACKRTGEPSGAFCGKGGARERADDVFFAAGIKRRRSKADFAPTRWSG